MITFRVFRCTLLQFRVFGHNWMLRVPVATDPTNSTAKTAKIAKCPQSIQGLCHRLFRRGAALRPCGRVRRALRHATSSKGFLCGLGGLRGSNFILSHTITADQAAVITFLLYWLWPPAAPCISWFSIGRGRSGGLRAAAGRCSRCCWFPSSPRARSCPSRRRSRCRFRCCAAAAGGCVRRHRRPPGES
jgi:hypothetical protein